MCLDLVLSPDDWPSGKGVRVEAFSVLLYCEAELGSLFVQFVALVNVAALAVAVSFNLGSL